MTFSFYLLVTKVTCIEMFMLGMKHTSVVAAAFGKL